MEQRQYSQTTVGLLSGVGSYVLWGILPIYWKQVHPVPAVEILAHRIVWSFIFMVLLSLILRQGSQLCQECRQLARQPYKLAMVVAGAFFISFNWCLYIWAVNDHRIVETSFGYYINPLMNVLFGMMLLKERITRLQSLAVLVATGGVLYFGLQFGSIPWVSLLLAISFSIYGLCKKMVQVSAITGMTLETLIVMPFAAGYLCWLAWQDVGVFGHLSWNLDLLLVGTGAITALPLLLFAMGAKRLPLSTMGFLQYVSPSIALAIGVVLYGEPFTSVHGVAFACIWLALFIYSLARHSWLAPWEEWLEGRFSGKKACRE